MNPEEIFGTFEYFKVDEGTWFITGLGGSLYMYLLEGEEYALLIDTAYGLGDLRGLVERLTRKPVLVANTHGHLDHVGGNGQWERVYMHKNAVIDNETLADGPCDVSKLPHPDYERVFIEEGYVFHLGNRDVEVLDISAHSNGSLAFLDASHGFLYCGDELESSQTLMYEIVPSGEYDFRERILRHKANMEKLKARSSEFRFLCPGHNGAPISREYLEDFIQLSEDLLKGTYQREDKLNHKYIEESPLGALVCRVRSGMASFFVRKEAGGLGDL